MQPHVSPHQPTDAELAGYREQLQRVADSRIFRDAEMLRRLLAFLGEATLSGEADSLKEYAVGVQALGRPDTYDTRTDSSVRVLAGKLRQKLAEYYSTEGAADVVEIGLPKGRYRLSFTRRAPASSADAALRMARFWRLAFVCAAVTAVVAVVAAFWTSRKAAPALPEVWTPEMTALWAPLLDGKYPILLSYDLAVFIGTDSYAVRHYSANDATKIETSKQLEILRRRMGWTHYDIIRDYADFGFVHEAFLISRLLAPRAAQISLKRGQELGWEDIHNNHIIYMGNGKTQPLIRDLLARTDFLFQSSIIRDLHPRPGEPEYYQDSSDRASDTKVGHAVIAMLSGSKSDQRAFILAAGAAERQWGIAEAVTDPRNVRNLVRQLRRHSGKLPPAWQAVVKMRFKSRVPVEIGFLSVREIRTGGLETSNQQ
ncbi:MAG: hypothetical protein ABFD89_08420 [Bryobacteraceae bacterium]